MPISEQEREVIEALVEEINSKVNEILSAREDVNALLRIHTDINDDAVEDNILNNAKNRARTAAQSIVDLL